jgi:hypothetical protein
MQLNCLTCHLFDYHNITFSPQALPSPALSNRVVTRSQSRRVTLDPQEQTFTTSPLANALNNTPVNKNLQTLRPSTSPDDCGPGQGSLFLADIVRVSSIDSLFLNLSDQSTY